MCLKQLLQMINSIQDVIKMIRSPSFSYGGGLVLLFGDWWQLPPIPDSAALFRPPAKQTTDCGEPDEPESNKDEVWVTTAGHLLCVF